MDMTRDGSFISFRHERSDSLYCDFFSSLRSIIEKESNISRCRDKLIRTNPTWVRDHIHEVKGFMYWEKDVQSFINMFLENQTAKGFFYEIFVDLDTVGFDMLNHLDYVDDDCRLIREDLRFALERLELEADIEYLMIEGVYRVWQSTGDTEWVEKNLKRLEKALNYCMSDPKRWDTKYGLMKRPRTIDTWDFINRPTSGVNRRILPDDPMGIMHGDNSGLYSAMMQLSKMFKYCAQDKKSSYWHEKAQEFRQRANKALWNGRFYVHYLPLSEDNYGMDEREQISLSNAYDINRGLPEHKMSVAILDEYARIRELTKEEYFAEWFSLYPPYPKFNHHLAGSYINGGIASFVAGELAHAAFEHGRESYGADILRRVFVKLWEDKTLGFLYTKDGKDQGGGPRGWGAASIIYALIEGLAGIKDQEHSFQKLKISPRWICMGEHYAHVKAVYGPSGRTAEYEYHWDEQTKNLDIKAYPGPKEIEWRILLPAGHSLGKASIGNEIIDAKTEKIEKSNYVVIKEEVPSLGYMLKLILIKAANN